MAAVRTVFVVVVVFVAGACGDDEVVPGRPVPGAPDAASAIDAAPPAIDGAQGGSVRLAGTVANVSAYTVLVNGDARVSVSEDGAFEFEERFPTGSTYQISVEPEGFCTVANSFGVFGDADVTNVQVTCTPFARRLFVTGGPGLWFAADDGVHGLELWQSDGTAAGTTLVRDIVAGPQPSFAAAGVVHDGALWFSVHQPNGEWWLFRSDGTASGTAPTVETPPVVRTTAVADRVLLWSRPTPGTGGEVWSTNGVAADTSLLSNYAAFGLLGAFGPVATDDWVYYVAAQEEIGTVLLATNGRELGVPVPIPFSGKFAIMQFAARGEVLFAAHPIWSTSGLQRIEGDSFVDVWDRARYVAVVGDVVFFGDSKLYATDGTTEGVVELAAVPFGRWNVALGDELMFVSGAGLWMSDGTVDGTREIASFAAGALDEARPVAAAGGAFFLVGDGELWFSDGTSGGTRHVGTGVVHADNALAGDASRLWFIGEDADHGAELWVSDGTAEGTRLVVDVNPGPDDGFGPAARQL